MTAWVDRLFRRAAGKLVGSKELFPLLPLLPSLFTFVLFLTSSGVGANLPVALE